MLKCLLCALVVAAALPAQLSVTLNAISGGVATTGGPTHPLWAGAILAYGMNFSSTGRSGNSTGSATLVAQPMATGSSGVGFTISAHAQSSGGFVNATSQLVALMTIQSPITTQVVLDFTGSGRTVQGGFGSLTLDVDNDGSLELSSSIRSSRIPLIIGPTPRVVAISMFAQAFLPDSQGISDLDMRVVPGICQGTRIAYACPGASIALWFRETIHNGIEVFIPNSSNSQAAHRHMIVVLGSRELLPPLLLPVDACPLHVDPVAYWFVPRPSTTRGGTVNLPVPPAVVPLVGYLQGVEYQSDTGRVFTTETLRIDCQ